jgi:hypothetical protein
MKTFIAGLEGIYNATIVCPLVAKATGKTIYAGSAYILDGSARLWLKADFFGTRKFDRPIHAV